MTASLCILAATLGAPTQQCRVGASALRTPSQQSWVGASALTRRSFVPAIAAAASLALVPRSDAKVGDYATFAAPTQPESTLGGAAQETGSRQVWDLEKSGLAGKVLDAKKQAVKDDWATMAAKVDKQLKKKQWVDLQSTLALKMAMLKSNMRDVARAQNGGDLIAYKDGSKDQPIFDYNLGIYALTPAAQKTEEVVKYINLAYAAAGLRDAGAEERVRSNWELAKQSFEEWCVAVGK
mmetsp:Transcript_22241/g.69418  ORF Transcript_22241/g.69418 Transcript_22241/m.69418 type:complete len:238 (+) Transcript_22241:3-716(+)